MRIGFTPEITHFTSSIFGARDMVLARNKLTTYSLSFFVIVGLVWGGKVRSVSSICVGQLGDSGVKPLGWNGCLCCKRKRCPLEYIFNKENEAKCKFASSCGFFLPQRVAAKTPFVVLLIVVLHPRRVDFERKLPRLIRCRYKSGTSGVHLDIYDDKDIRTDLV